MATVRTIEARAVISAQDKTGGVFAGIARKMADLAQSASRTNAMAARAAQISETQGRAAAVSARNRVRADAIGPSGPPRARGRASSSSSWTEYAGSAGAFVTGGVAGVGAYELGRRAIGAQVRQLHEGVRASSAGLSADDIEELKGDAFRLSRKSPAFSQTEVMHMLRNARSVVGSLEEAQEVAEPLMKLRTVALGANPGNAAAMAEDFDKLVKAMELKGVTQDLPKFTKYMDGMAKALNMFGDTIRPSEYYEAFKYGRQATQNLSEEYINSVAPTILQELGGASAGVAHAAFFRAIVGGKMSNLATNELDKLGLLDRSKVVRTKTGSVKGVGPGGIMGSRVAAEDPYRWVQEYLLPAFKKAGIVDPHDQQERLARMFSNQVAAQLVGLFATQQPRIEKDRRMTRGAGGLDSADDIQRRDPYLAWSAIKAQADNLATSLKGLPVVVDAMNETAKLLGDLAKAFRHDDKTGDTPAQKSFNRLINQLLFGDDFDGTRSEALTLGIGWQGGRRTFGFGPGGTSNNTVVPLEVNQPAPGIPLPPARPASLGGRTSTSAPPNYTLRDILGGDTIKAEISSPVTAQLTGSAEVKGSVDTVIRVEAGSSLIAIEQSVKTLTAQVRGMLNTQNGRGSTGVSAPDSGASQ